MLYRTRQKLGFTLVEIVIVIVIIGVLASLSIMAWQGVQERAFNTNILNSMTAYRNAFEIYSNQEHTYPSVPSTGNYCLQTSAFTSAEVHAIDPSETLPTTITSQGVTETAYYCREITWQPQRHAGYPPLNKALASVASVPSGPENGKKQQINADSGGVFALYDSDPTDGTKTRVTIKGMMKGRTCPGGTFQSWISDPSDVPKTICQIVLQKTYVTTFTGEPWAYEGTID